MRFSVCVDALYPNHSTAAAIAAVARAGLPAIEFWNWWDKDLDAIEVALEEHGIHLAAFCTRHFDLVHPQKRDEFLSGLQASLPVARRLGCPFLITQTGDRDAALSPKEQAESLEAGLKACQPLLDAGDVTLLVEPLNTYRDHPNHFLSDSQEAFELIRKLDHPNIRLLFDFYHQQISCGNLLESVLPNLDLIGHFHAASVPGRQELDQGELHYGHIFHSLSQAGYLGYIGLEYFPSQEPEQGFGREPIDARSQNP